VEVEEIPRGLIEVSKTSEEKTNSAIRIIPLRREYKKQLKRKILIL